VARSQQPSSADKPAPRTSDVRLSTVGRWYVGVISAAGLAVLAAAVYELAAGRVDVRWWGLALLTALSASLTIKLPAVPARISVSETFVFTALVVFGIWAGLLTVAVDGLVASLWIRRRTGHQFYRTLFNVAGPTFALWAASELCFGLGDVEPIVHQSAQMQELLTALFLLATVYFFLNSWLIAFAIGFERRIPPYTVWSSNFLWLAINYFGGASVSVLLVLLFNTTVVNSVAVGITIPLLTFFYLTFRIAMGRSEDTINHLTERNQAAEARARLEAELRDAHRLESLGLVAARIADDFDNLLTPIVGSTETILGDPRTIGFDRDEVVNIKHAAERAQALTRQLRAFGRRQDLALAPVDLRVVMESFAELLRRTVRTDIRVEMRVDGDVLAVRADVAQIEQALLNLAINAEDAMPAGGVLTLGLSETVVDGIRCATLRVSDTGHSTDAAIVRNQGDAGIEGPPSGRGVGLGMSTVESIAQQHGGTVAVESDSGRGNTYLVHLPLDA